MRKPPSMTERYELSKFLEYRSQLTPAQFSMESRLSQLMKRAEYPLTSYQGSGRKDHVAIPFYLNLETPTSSNVGRVLLDFDLEVRRTTSFRLRGSIAPPRNAQNLEVVGAQTNDVLRIALALSKELRLALMTQPIDFLLMLDWFWDFRYVQSRVRSPLSQRDPRERWSNILSSVTESTSTTTGSIAAEMTIDNHGVTSFGFQSERMPK